MKDRKTEREGTLPGSPEKGPVRVRKRVLRVWRKQTFRQDAAIGWSEPILWKNNVLLAQKVAI